MNSLWALFWLFTLCLALFLYLFTNYLIKQHHEQVTSGATISAKGLANVMGEKIDQQRLMVKALVLHNSERIYELSQGAGYPFDLFELLENVKELLPEATQLAILDAKGQAVVGSEGVHIGATCQTKIKYSLEHSPLKVSFLGPHNSPNGQLHYDVVYPLKRGEVSATLFLSFDFDEFKELIVNFNSELFEFVLVNSGKVPKVIVSENTEGARSDGRVLEQDLIEQSLVSIPVLDGQWLLLGLPQKNVFDGYIQRACIIASATFVAFFVLMWLLLRYLNNVEQARKRLENNSVQDALFNVGPTVLFQKKADSNMGVEYVSPNVSSLLGCNAQDVLNRSSFVELILLEDVAAVRVAILNAFTHHEQEIRLEYRIKSTEYQGHCWVYDLTRIVYDESGKPVWLQSYVTSIHAQKMAEQRANRLIENAPNAMATTDRYGVVFRVNQAFEKMFGYERNDLVGMSLELCIYETSQGIWREHIHKLLNEEECDSILMGAEASVEGINSEGKTFPVEVGCSRVDTLEGFQLVYMIRDVSIQIGAQKQMQIAKERAEALALARSRFVATMSHEIRTPLNGVLGMANLLMNTPLNPIQTKYLKAIEQSGDALLKVVNSILDFAKLDEGGVRLESKAFDLNKVVRETIQILQLQAQESEVDLFSESNLPETVQLIGDAGRVQQILINLLSNAIKFSPQGRVEIIVKAQLDAKASDPLMQVLIEVKDNGVGIAKRYLGQLFDSFTQADDSTTREFGGTGLGLTISKQLVELMQGEIGVVSEEGMGSLFWVNIPFSFVNSPSLLKTLDELNKSKPLALPVLNNSKEEIERSFSDSIVSEEALTKAISSNRVLENKTVLLIEDNETNQEIVLAFLQRLGAGVDIAKNGLEGLSFWRMDTDKYDLILMDCQMPVMDGYEATILIRKEEASSFSKTAVPIIALTANAMPEDRERCFSVGMNDYITKPIDIELFNQILIKWLVPNRASSDTK